MVTYVRSLLAALDGFDLTVAAHGPGPLRAAVEDVGARYVELRHLRRAVHPFRDAAGFIELVRLLRFSRPHIIHINSSKAGVVGRLAAAVCRVPIRIFTVHGWAFTWYRPRFLYLWPDRFARRFTTTTICVAEIAREVGVAARACDADRTVVIPNGVELPSREGVGAAPGRDVPLVVSVGRLTAPKDFRTLIAALARVDVAFRAKIVGDGHDRAELESMIVGSGLTGRVELLGVRDDVPELLRAADVFVLATTSEAMPISILEAMAAGLPVVASAVGGVPELVVDGSTGSLVSPGDPECLGRALETLLTSAPLRQQMGIAGRERAERLFDIAQTRRRHLELYEKLLAERNLPCPSMKAS